MGSDRKCYVEPAPRIDVMWDQLHYLLAHGRQGCPAGCGDCLRLKQVESWLLQPFCASGGGRSPQQARSKTGSVRDYLQAVPRREPRPIGGAQAGRRLPGAERSRPGHGD